MMISHRARPVVFGIRTLAMLLYMKISSRFDVRGWKYFFGGWGIFRVDEGKLCLKPGSWIEENALLHVVCGTIRVGNRTFINRGSTIICRKEIHIGNDVLIGDHVSMYDHDHDISNPSGPLPYGQSGYVEDAISIGDNVWIGSHSVVLKGATIGSNSVVGAGSVVVCDIPPAEVWAGVPAKKIRGA